MNGPTKGISVCHPVSLKEEYLLRCARYAIEHGIGHFEVCGPIHSPVRGNCDGMMLYRKYARFNDYKNQDYVKSCEASLNRVLDLLAEHGIKSYCWHHELELPVGFEQAFPEIRNSDGDVEVTHPVIRAFLERKMEDFFHTYPKMTGIVLTLHETRIPLLKLKHQKLNKVERVRYVTEILYSACKRLGKELIVRPFASIAQDYDDLMEAYEAVSPELVVCDKWTKFDWSLIAPHNPFLARIRNPLVVEGDIFGEYFGVGYLPILLKDHIAKKAAYCRQFAPKGYVLRIDRSGNIPFGTPNEVNLEIADAVLDGRDVDAAVDAFFEREYGPCGETVRLAMEGTEDIQIKALCAQTWYTIHALSKFPGPATVQRQYRYFRSDFRPTKGTWQDVPEFRGIDHEAVLADKKEAIRLAGEKLALIRTLEGKLPRDKYYALYMRFANLELVCRIWEQVALIYSSLARYFETAQPVWRDTIYTALSTLKELDDEGYALLGEDFYCEALGPEYDDDRRRSPLQDLRNTLGRRIELELETFAKLKGEGLYDFLIAGGFSEEHGHRNEPNFSSPQLLPEGVCRCVGSERGKAWSVVKAHGWISYELKVRPDRENTLVISGKSKEGPLSYDLALDGEQVARVAAEGEGFVEYTHRFTPATGTEKITVRIDRNSEYMPYIHTIKVL